MTVSSTEASIVNDTELNQNIVQEYEFVHDDFEIRRFPKYFNGYGSKTGTDNKLRTELDEAINMLKLPDSYNNTVWELYHQILDLEIPNGWLSLICCLYLSMRQQNIAIPMKEFVNTFSITISRFYSRMSRIQQELKLEYSLTTPRLFLQLACSVIEFDLFTLETISKKILGLIPNTSTTGKIPQAIAAACSCVSYEVVAGQRVPLYVIEKVSQKVSCCPTTTKIRIKEIHDLLKLKYDIKSKGCRYYRMLQDILSR